MNRRTALQLWAAGVTSFVLSLIAWLNFEPIAWEFEFQPPEPALGRASFETVFERTLSEGSAHAVAIGVFEERTDLYWFEGTRESHEDVVIKRAQLNWDGAAAAWISGAAETFLDRHKMASVSWPRQAIWSLGNAVQLTNNDTSMLATVVSVGGWAAAAIAQVSVEDDQITNVRKLRLSPMFNRSHLVRSRTVAYADATLGIPAYFEMGNAFGVLVRLDKHLRVRDKRRISQGRLAIQPEIIVTGPQNAVALMRNFDDETNQLIASWTADGGQSWSDSKLLDLPNPDAPVAATLTRDGKILMAYNDAPDHARTLALALSEDGGRTWQQIAKIEDGEEDVRYPSLRRLSNGDYLLAYSFGSKTGIRAHVFNDAWVGQQHEP